MAGYTKTHSLDVTPTGDTVYAAIVNKVDKNDDDIITWINNLKKSYASSSAPTTPTPDEGQLWWDSANDILKGYDGSNWQKLATPFNFGTTTISSGSATTSIAHGLGVSPTVALITPRSSTSLWVSARNTTSITVSRGGTAGTIQFDWMTVK